MTHIMITSTSGTEAKSLYYLLQRAGLGAVELSVSSGEQAVRAAVQAGANVVLAEAAALGQPLSQAIEELQEAMPACQLILYFDSAMQMEEARQLKRQHVELLLRPLHKAQSQRAVSRALERVGSGSMQLRTEQILTMLSQQMLDDLLKGDVRAAGGYLEALGLNEQSGGAVYMGRISAMLEKNRAEQLAAELRRRLLDQGCMAVLRVSGSSLTAVGFAAADRQPALMGVLETALKRFCAERRLHHCLGSASFECMSELPMAAQSAAAELAPQESWVEPAAGLRERRTTLPPRVEQVRSYIQEHFCEELSLEDIANACDMSKYYLCHVFKENMGISAFNYLIWLRMEEARRLLATTSLKVAQVGLQVGYSDPNYFITAFKKQEGMTPTEYRIGQRTRLAAAE